MRISDWSSDVCSSDLRLTGFGLDNKMEFLNFHDSFTDEGSVAIDYDPVEHRWWRIWEDGGTVFWGTSATGLLGTWQVQRSETTPAWVVAEDGTDRKSTRLNSSH